MRKSFVRRKKAANIKLLEIITSHVKNGTEPHPELVKYLRLKTAKLEASIKKSAFKKQKGFYQSKEWLQLRYETIARYGKKCQACGDTSGPFHVDHIKPRSRYPEFALDPDNVQILCSACNWGKSNRSSEDWR